jgi:hypothetical protein
VTFLSSTTDRCSKYSFEVVISESAEVCHALFIISSLG